MPIINIVPKTKKIEDQIDAMMTLLRHRILALVVELLDIPVSDVVVNLQICPYRNADNAGANMVLYLETSPGEKIGNMANLLCHSLANLLVELKLTEDGVEVWVRMVTGSWCLAGSEGIIDTAQHVLPPK